MTTPQWILGIITRFACTSAGLVYAVENWDRLACAVGNDRSNSSAFVRTILYLSTTFWMGFGPLVVIATVHIYRTPVLLLSPRTRDSFLTATSLYVLHINGFIFATGDERNNWENIWAMYFIPFWVFCVMFLLNQ